MDFDRWLQRFVTAIEKIIFRVALVFVVLLFIVQAVLLNGDLRLFLSKTDKVEGKPVMQEAEARETMGRKIITEKTQSSYLTQEGITLVLELKAPPEGSCTLYLLINNEVVEQFGNESICVNVQPGDLLEVIGKVSGDRPASISIVEIHGKLKSPEKGYELKTFGERDLIAWIIPE
ncbi:MAG: hypothetical protein GX996_06365 [Firmicutes bacterium]|nr:hypothetical protein [Bacillota bacterium]